LVKAIEGDRLTEPENVNLAQIEGTERTPAELRRVGYLPSLDGWRAIAVLGVMLTHDRAWQLFGHSSEGYKGYGGFGVYLFFAISGFLITTRILEERRLIGHFDIGGFYLRRIFRIQPAALLYLSVVAVLLALGVTAETWTTWRQSLLLYLNFTYRATTPSSLTGHFWTLAVEEHFYILLSVTLWLTMRYRRLAPLVVAVLTGYLIFMLPAVQQTGVQHHWWRAAVALRSTWWQLPGLVLAALVAVLVKKPQVERAVRWGLRPWVAFAATLLVMLLVADVGQVHELLHYHRSLTRLRPFRGFSTQLVFASMYLLILWVVATVFHPRSWTTRFLELRPMRFIGRISYSLYLWHILVYWVWSDVLFSAGGPWSQLAPGRMPYTLLERPLRVATVFAVATLSYYFVEKPMMRMGHRLAPPAQPGRPELAGLSLESRNMPRMPRAGSAAREASYGDGRVESRDNTNGSGVS
jgi:peptidoglycan/LPS O-acetylase OafA/YrhL